MTAADKDSMSGGKLDLLKENCEDCQLHLTQQSTAGRYDAAAGGDAASFLQLHRQWFDRSAFLKAKYISLAAWLLW